MRSWHRSRSGPRALGSGDVVFDCVRRRNSKRLRRTLPEHCKVILRKPAEFVKAQLHRDGCHGGRTGCALVQDGVNSAETLVPEEADRAEAEYLLKGAVQGAPRYAERRANFRHVHRTRPGVVEILLDLADQPS